MPQSHTVDQPTALAMNSHTTTMRRLARAFAACIHEVGFIPYTDMWKHLIGYRKVLTKSIADFPGLMTKYGPRRDKTCLRGSDKVRLKPVSSATETS